jgi:large subunit ribosomal protein L21
MAWTSARTFASGLTIDGGVTPAYDVVPESVVLVSDDRKPVIDPVSGLDVVHKAVYGVVQVRSHQFKVSPDDLIFVDKIKGVDVNDVVSLPRVLMLGNKDRTVIGRPTVPGAEVLALVEEHARDGKKIIFKKKRRKNYRRSNGFRAQLTALRVLEVNGIEEA